MAIFSVQFSSVVQLCPTLCDLMDYIARQASQSIINSPHFLRLMSSKSVIPSNHLILCHPLLLLPSIFPSIRLFSSELVLRIRCLKDQSFSFSISPSNEYSGLISFRTDWLDLLAVQGTLKSLLQHCSSKVSILQRSAFLYSPTLTSIHDYWKNHIFDQTDLCWQNIVSTNLLSRLVISFLPRSNHLLISWLQSPSAVIFGAPKNSLPLFPLFGHLFAMK